MKRSQLSCLLMALGLSLCLSATVTAATASSIQRFRLTSGTYSIGGGGGSSGSSGGGSNGASRGSAGGIAGGAGPRSGGGPGGLPGSPGGEDEQGRVRIAAYCIDHERAPPGRDVRMRGVAGEANVERIVGEQVVATKSLKEATTGEDAWLAIEGDFLSATSLLVRPLKNDAHYRLIVGATTLVGEFQQETEATWTAWSANEKLNAASAQLDAMEGAFAELLGATDPMLEDLRRARQEWQWRLFGKEASANAVSAVTISEHPPTAIVRRVALGSARQVMSPGSAAAYLVGLSAGNASLLQPAIMKKAAAILQAVDVPVEVPSAPDIERLNASFRGPGDIASSLEPSTVERLRQVLTLETARLLDTGMSLGDAIATAPYRLLPEDVWTNGVAETAWSKDRSLLSAALLKARFGKHLPPAPPVILSVQQYDDGDFAVDPPGGSLLEPTEIPAREMTLAKLKQLANGAQTPSVVHGDESTRKALEQLGIRSSSRQQLRNAGQAAMFAKDTRTLPDGTEEQTLRHTLRDADEPGLAVTYLKLDSKGDSIIIQAPDKSVILVDTGLTKDLIDKLRNYFGGTVPPLRIVITHTDADHIRGLSTLLRTAGVTLHEVVVGRYEGDMTPTAKEILSDLQTIQKMSVKDTTSKGVLHFIGPQNSSPLFAADYAADDYIERWTLKPIGELQLTLFHKKEASRTNEGGLLVKLQYRGMSQLLTDDVDQDTLNALMRSEFSYELGAGILKWPHHVWFPTKPADQEVLAQFLRRVHPHTIIFSNTGDPSHAENWRTRVGPFIQRVLGRGMVRLWTLGGKDGAHIRVLTRNLSSPRLLPLDERPSVRIRRFEPDETAVWKSACARHREIPTDLAPA